VNLELADLKKAAEEGGKMLKAKKSACKRIVDYRDLVGSSWVTLVDIALLNDLMNSRFSPLVINGSNSP
jgi:hypothetical protein